MSNTVKVHVSFDLEIDADEWRATSANKGENVSETVAAHAEMVVRDLYADMGWTR
jgi:hypothetical protein